MEFVELIGDLSKRIGIELEPDESGAVSFSADDLQVTALHLAELNQVALVGDVGEPPPEEHVERLYRALLIANHSFAGTGGATLSVNPETGNVSLCRVVQLATADADSFYADVEKFVDVLETWHRIVTDFRGEVENGSTSESDENADATPAGLSGFGGGFMQV